MRLAPNNWQKLSSGVLSALAPDVDGPSAAAAAANTLGAAASPTRQPFQHILQNVDIQQNIVDAAASMHGRSCW